MKRNSKFVKAGRCCLALMMALATTLTPLPQVSHAGRGLASGATEATWEGSGDGGDAGTDRWWGAAGAVLCGAEIALIRYAPALGSNPYALAAGLSGCLLAALDVWTT